jgi:hypothetical protein
MATTVGIVGKSGSGKSTSIQNMDPESTLIINADKKILPFRGFKTKFSVEKKNYWASSDIPAIKEMLHKVNTEKARFHIKAVVVDTVNAMMLDDEMKKIKTPGYDKWQDLAQSIYDLIVYANSMRDDLVVFFMFHQVEYRDDNTGVIERRILTNGRKLEKIQLETKLPIVLYSIVEGTGGNNQYFFETQSNCSTGKSPAGMFESFKIPNDLLSVLTAIKAYE